MDIPSEYLNGFSLFVQNSINVRNLISHNMVLYGEDVKYQSAELNALYEHLHNDKIKDNVFRMPHLIKCVSKITCESPEDDLYIKTITAINNLKMSQAHKEKILKLYML
jgi:abortive infection bacteriophage resistance protein